MWTGSSTIVPRGMSTKAPSSRNAVLSAVNALSWKLAYFARYGSRRSGWSRRAWRRLATTNGLFPVRESSGAYRPLTNTMRAPSPGGK